MGHSHGIPSPDTTRLALELPVHIVVVIGESDVRGDVLDGLRGDALSNVNVARNGRLQLSELAGRHLEDSVRKQRPLRSLNAGGRSRAGPQTSERGLQGGAAGGHAWTEGHRQQPLGERQGADTSGNMFATIPQSVGVTGARRPLAKRAARSAMVVRSVAAEAPKGEGGALWSRGGSLMRRQCNSPGLTPLSPE